MSYIPASEVRALDRLFGQPIDIVAACNRVQRRYECALAREWLKGIGVALSGVLVAAGLVWVMM